MKYSKPVLRREIAEKKPKSIHLSDSGCGMCKVFKKS